MSKEIKTRQIHKDIKVINKVAVGTERVREAYVRTKESVEQTQSKASPEEYAGDKITQGTQSALKETVHQMGKAGSFEPVYQLKEQNVKEALEQAGRRACQKREKNKAIERRGREVKAEKQTEQIINNTGKETIKYADRTVKTSESTSHTVIKTTQEAEKATQKLAKESILTTKRSAQAVRKMTYAAEEAVRKVVKISLAAVKAIIAAMKELIAGMTIGGWIAVLILVIVILFGGVLCFIGGDNSSTVSPVSDEVEAYEPLIRHYANQYGIGEYVELIKAVMMQESGGRGLDPMQSSEGSFNTRYPRRPNGITDPEYSICCGVQEVKSCLESAEVESPIDMEHIKLALQGYNFGNGYILWAKRYYGGYTVANAAEFSDMMAQRMGWSSYGDKQYVSHVLRYYAFGRIPTGIGNQAIVQVALSQEGNGGETYWSWYGFNSRVEWCACFVSWCADQCGYIDSGVIPKFSLCSDGVSWFSSHGRFRDGSYVPVAGDIIFFDWGDNGSIDHVGIVESVTGGRVNTIEGNSGNSCRKRSYVIGNNSIYGYGVPAY